MVLRDPWSYTSKEKYSSAYKGMKRPGERGHDEYLRLGERGFQLSVWTNRLTKGRLQHLRCNEQNVFFKVFKVVFVASSNIFCLREMQSSTSYLLNLETLCSKVTR